MSLIPASEPLSCYQGYSWSQEFDFYQDTAETLAFNFSNWIVALTVKSRKGVLVNAAIQVTGGTVVASLTSDQTALLDTGAGKYVLDMHDGSTPPDKEPLSAGPFVVSALL